MARVSIYVPEPMRERMNALGDRLNWSEVAQEAFDKAMDDALNEDFRDKVRDLITRKLEDFWGEVHTPMPPREWFDQVDAVALMADQACQWIGQQCELIGTALVDNQPAPIEKPPTIGVYDTGPIAGKRL